MKTPLIVTLLFTAATLFAADPAPNASTPRQSAERNRKLVEKFGSSVCSAYYWLKTDADGESPAIEIPYKCPNCGGTHHRSVESLIEENRPLIFPAFAIAPNRVMIQSVPLRDSFIERVEIAIGEKRFPAKAVERYPEAEALLLETAAPIEGITPITFDGDPKTAKPTYFFVVDEDGLIVAGNKPFSPEIRHYPDMGGKDVISGLVNALVVDDRNNAITLSFRENRFFGEEPFPAPSTWKGVPADDLEKRYHALEKRLSQSIVPVHLHIDSKEKDEGGSSRVYYHGDFDDDDDDAEDGGDTDTVGYVMPGGGVMVPWKRSPSALYRLDKSEIALADGKKVPLQFSGAFPEHAFLLFKPEGGSLPEGFQPFVLDQAPIFGHYLETLFSVKIRNTNGEVHLQLAPFQLDEFSRIRGGAVVPDLKDDDDPSVTAAGALFTLPGRYWIGNRWSSRFPMTAGKIGTILAAGVFHANYKPRTGKDRKQVAWIGAEAQSLTPELAREKKALAFLKAAKAPGALVNRVYPDTPAAKAGIKEGDILIYARPARLTKRFKLEAGRDFGGIDWSEFFDLSVDRAERVSITPWPNIEAGINTVFSSIGIGEQVVIAWVTDGVKKEATLTLEAIPVHFQNATKVKNKELEMIVADMTFEVRGYFRMDPETSGVVITKVKAGSPAAVAGLHPLEIITKINETPIKDAKHFQELLKDKKDITFTVRRLTATRMVRIQLEK
ncbi:MAG: PDZ domain-containing protein [Kiritimatiellae bacterium]|nr:PDZ domain-containing protein [Kiritimatiellia bacterium]